MSTLCACALLRAGLLAGLLAAPSACLAAEAASRWDDPRATGQDAAAAELASAAAPADAGLLVQVARLRQSLAEQWALAAERPPGAGEGAPAARELLARSGAEAKACASAARRAWALRAPQAARLLGQGRPEAEALALVDASGAEPLYLEAVCAAAWARAQGFTHLIERRLELRAALGRVAQLQPDLDDSGADRELGRLLAALPAYAGGELSSARSHFQAALERSPGSIRTRVLFARGIAVKLQDRPLFDRLLREAIERTPGPRERAWVDQARLLQARAAELFSSGG